MYLMRTLPWNCALAMRMHLMQLEPSLVGHCGTSLDMLQLMHVTYYLDVQLTEYKFEAVQDHEDMNELDRLVRESYNLDFPERLIDDIKQFSQEDKLFLRRIEESSKFVNGHYKMALPFRQENVTFPDNYDPAHRQLGQVRRKMERNSKFHEEYVTFMQKMFVKGYAEVIPEEEAEPCDGHTWYIPQHGVYHPQKKKLRVVFNCAAEYDGTSLNKQLLSDPDLTSNLIGVLMRFRQGKYLAIGDIEAMFYQVRVTEEHWNYQRFLWWKNDDYTQRPIKCRMRVHMFGTTSSPSCANAALLKTASDHEHEFDAEIVDIIRHNFYVDDCLTSDDEPQKLTNKLDQVTDLCKKGGFKLTKWVTNSDTIKKTDSVEHLNLDKPREDTVEHALGVTWTVNTDMLGFKVKIKDDSCTRRNILSVVSSVYDPLGLVSPFILKAMILLQDICRERLDWDDEVCGENLKTWKQWIADLPQLEQLKIPRCYRPIDFGTTTACQLHVFRDASNKGYGVAMYLRFFDVKEEFHCSLIFSKARVTPLKKITIPRLELTAACVEVRLSRVIMKEIQHKVDYILYWTDSMAVIRYVRNEVSRFKTFVANRIAEIHDDSDPHQWRYLPSVENPADPASRGLDMKSFKKVALMWFNGPEFLLKPESEWPSLGVTGDIDIDDPELKVTTNTTTVHSMEDEELDRLIKYCSTWTKLKRFVSYFLLFKDYLLKQTRNSTKNKNVRKSPCLTVEVLQRSELASFKHVQHRHLSDVISALKYYKQGQVNRQIWKRDPFIIDDLVRVGGRLQRSKLQYESKHPLLLPKESQVTQLIVQHAHEVVGHMGRAGIMVHLRQQYRIVRLGHLIKKITSRCVICRRYAATQKRQKMADLPTDSDI
ncbi:uncharacterized protein LOC124132206 [Haliotis rufescens]|uniref:uncharacterized protein LOC124132206 n=1 Tax=Haliotis rufescens TaxID=6454 RepID=UPI00201ED013|nr:uncharacterized protein LOC124132206 [Haliotis rufescens]